jgi:uncharacterized protein YkwD
VYQQQQQEQEQEQQQEQQDAENPFLDPPFSRIKTFNKTDSWNGTVIYSYRAKHGFFASWKGSEMISKIKESGCICKQKHQKLV